MYGYLEKLYGTTREERIVKARNYPGVPYGPMIADWTYLANSQVQGSEWGVEHHCQQYGAFLLSLGGPKATIPPKVVSTLSSFLCNKPYAYVLRGLSLQGEKRALSSRALQ